MIARLHGMLASDVGRDLLRHLATFVLRQEILCRRDAGPDPLSTLRQTPYSRSDKSMLAPRPQRPAARMVASRTAVSAQRAR